VRDNSRIGEGLDDPDLLFGEGDGRGAVADQHAEGALSKLYGLIRTHVRQRA
jgi:hypothetical protein